MNEIITQFAGHLRAPAFLKMNELITTVDGCIMETGCIRTWPDSPDGASTVIFAQMSKEYNRPFFTVDLNTTHCATAHQALKEMGLDGNIACDNSLNILRHMQGIALLYLDSFDHQTDHPLRSQRHAMAELGAAWGGLNDRCIVAIDDCHPTDGGKAGLVIPFLLDNGFIIQHNDYTTVLTRNL